MVLIIALAGALISAVTMLMIVPRSTKQIETLTKNEMTNLAQAYSTDLNDKLMEKRVLSYDGYANILRNVKISGLDTSYAYLLDKEGIMRFHPTESKWCISRKCCCERCSKSYEKGGECQKRFCNV